MVLLASAALLYAAAALIGGYAFYGTLKPDPRGLLRRGWAGKVHRNDAKLGFAPIPGARGMHLFPKGPGVRMRYDPDGFRGLVQGEATARQLSAEEHRKRPLVLALGGSFTYGDACRAVDAYAFRLAESLGGSALNAGVCSYGLAQMWLQARELVPRFEPDVLVTQYSPWLVERATTPFAPAYHGAVPTPYFTEREGDRLGLQRPVFPAAMFDYRPWDFRATPRGAGDFLSFLRKVALPLRLRDDWHLAGYHIRRITGGLPAPTERLGRIEALVYRELAELCRSHGCRALAVVLGADHQPVEVRAALYASGMEVVNAHQVMLKLLATRDEHTYFRAYGHTRGTLLVDRHPNPQAHRVIATALATALRREP